MEGAVGEIRRMKGCSLISAFKKKCNAGSGAFKMHFHDQQFDG